MYHILEITHELLHTQCEGVFLVNFSGWKTLYNASFRFKDDLKFLEIV